MATTNKLKAAQDTGALLTYLDSRSDVAGRRIGAVGFYMGGGAAVASTWPDRFAAVTSFRGGRLATDDNASGAAGGRQGRAGATPSPEARVSGPGVSRSARLRLRL